MKFTSIHKKIRGMRRRARKIPLWGNYHKNLDIDAVINYKKEYVKLWISPFYNLYQINDNEVGKKNPPYKFRVQVMHQLIDIYQEWKKQLDRLNEPYYLKIWLGDPIFMDSQVVTAIETEIDYYEHLFIKNPDQKAFPYKNVHPCFDMFIWERCVNGYYVWESELETIEEVRQIEKKAFETYEDTINGKIEKYYFISTGDMWIGYFQ